MKDLACDLGPEFLQYVHWSTKDNLLRPVCQRVPRNVVFAWEPQGGYHGRGVIRRNVRNVRGRMTSVVVCQEAVNDGVQRAPLAAVVCASDIPNILM